MEIRRASADDLALIVANNCAMARETEAVELDPQIVEAGVRALLADPGKGFYLLAERDGQTAGQLMVTTEWSDWRNAHFWWIQSVYVRPGARRTGIYRALHRCVVDLARTAGNVCGIRLYVERHNDTAQATYRALGMAASHYDLFEVDFVLGARV